MMFDINNQYRIESSLPVIVDNYDILHYDEYPILFSGINKYGNRLISSLAYEDFDNNTFRYFVIIVEEKEYFKFFNKHVSYLELISNSQETFIQDKDINNHVIETYRVPFEVIPQDYLPLANSFIPNLKVSNSFDFAFELNGKLANLHKAFVHDITTINQRIYSYLVECVESLNRLSLKPVIYSQPSQEGSYRLNFDVEFLENNQITLFQINREKVGEFINHYLYYIAYLFPNEEDDILSNSYKVSGTFRKLSETLVEVYESGSVAPSSTMVDLLIENINNSAIKLADVTEYLKSNESFNAIAIGNYQNSGNFSTIGYLDENYKSSVAAKLLPDDAELTTQEIIVDQTPQKYRILVFRLNRDTGRGGARLYYQEELFYTVRLNIEMGEKQLSNSIFTKSLDEDKVVDVEGIAFSVDGVIKKLECFLKLNINVYCKLLPHCQK